MIDVKRRQTLKTLTTSAMVLTGLSIRPVSASALALDSVNSKDRHNIELEVHYSASGATDKLQLYNPSSRDVEVSMQFTGDIAVPGGQIDVARLMQNGPVKISAGQTRRFNLARVDDSKSLKVSGKVGSHQTMRFPVSDNVFIDRIAVVADRADFSGHVPLLMRKIA